MNIVNEIMAENFPNLKKKHFKNTISIIFSRLMVTLSQNNILKAGGELVNSIT